MQTTPCRGNGGAHTRARRHAFCRPVRALRCGQGPRRVLDAARRSARGIVLAGRRRSWRRARGGPASARASHRRRRVLDAGLWNGLPASRRGPTSTGSTLPPDD